MNEYKAEQEKIATPAVRKENEAEALEKILQDGVPRVLEETLSPQKATQQRPHELSSGPSYCDIT